MLNYTIRLLHLKKYVSLMSKVIIFKLSTFDSYDQWYDFLNWLDYSRVREISTWDDRSYSDTMYKAYKIDNDKDLTYILLKWDVIFKGDYSEWIALRDNIETTIYSEDDINWIERDD